MTSFRVQAHNDHYHVLDDTSDMLDDRSFNPWMYTNKATANKVAALLNRGMDPLHVKEMDTDQLEQAYRS